MKLSKTIKLFLLTLMFLPRIIYGVGDLRPGSRSIYVRNHDSAVKADFLEVYLRECRCENPPDLMPMKENTVCYCPCWHDERAEDQPAAQGNPSSCIPSYRIAFGTELPGFHCCKDKVSHEPYFIVPSPEVLVKILGKLGLDKSIEIVPRTASLDLYLGLLAKGKIPVSDIPDENEVANISLLYHEYFHDLFNHIPIWTAFPDYLRHMFSMRMTKLLQVFYVALDRHQKNPHVADYIQLAKYFAAENIDASMGILSNRIFTREPFELLDMVSSNRDVESINTAKQESVKFLSGIINLGMDVMTNNKCVFTSFDINIFIAVWFKKYDSLLREWLKDIRWNGIEQLESIYIVKKEPQAFIALKNLSELSLDEIENIKGLIFSVAEEGLEGKSLESFEFEDRLITIEGFYFETKARVEEALRTFNEMLASSRSE